MIFEQLLQTKLSVPQRRPVVVPRPRLIERLNAGISSKLILISAPAGFGKTTLATEWVSRAGFPVTWISLDERDNDTVRCMEYFIAALRKIKPMIGENALKTFRSTQNILINNILIELINEIYALSEHFIMVIDDYHVIENPQIHSALSFLINNAPPNLHLVILTRADLPIPLAHVRGRGQLTELRARDLRFTLDEVEEFLNKVMNLNLSKEEISSLDARSEGWVAGLQMAAISLKGRTDKAGFIRAFSGSNRDILDYLFEEVFQRQAPDIQSFLLETAILDRFTGSLCNAVTGRNDSSTLLDKMRRANLFVINLDDEGLWYRYHRLFADLLLHNLNNSQPEQVPILHQRASEWYEHNGLIPLAIEHALSGEDYTRAAAITEKYAEKTLMRGELATFISWVDSLPELNIRSNPILIVYRVMADLFLRGDLSEEGQALLQEAEKYDLQGKLAGPIKAVQSISEVVKGDANKSTILAHQALDILPPESQFWRSHAITSLGQFGLLRGNIPSVPTAIKLFNEAIEIAEKTGIFFSMILALRRLAEINLSAGHLKEARTCYQRIVDITVDGKGQPLPLASFGLIGLGKIEHEMHNLNEAAILLERGIQLATGKLGLWQIDGYVHLARTKQEQGDPGSAKELINKARQIINEFHDTGDYSAFVAANEARLSLLQGKIEEAAAWIWERGLERTPGTELSNEPIHNSTTGYYVSELEQITLARVYLLQGHPEKALGILTPLLDASEKLGRNGTILEICILKALAYKALGNPAVAIDYLKRSLLLAEPEVYISLFTDEGAALASLLHEALRQNITPEFTGQLLNTIAGPAPIPPPVKKTSQIIEPLSDRELEVLDLIAKGLANKEIASRLCIELRTVKWHTGNILGKLGVKSRTQAIARSQELEIIKDSRLKSDP